MFSKYLIFLLYYHQVLRDIEKKVISNISQKSTGINDIVSTPKFLSHSAFFFFTEFPSLIPFVEFDLPHFLKLLRVLSKRVHSLPMLFISIISLMGFWIFQIVWARNGQYWFNDGCRWLACSQHFPKCICNGNFIPLGLNACQFMISIFFCQIWKNISAIGMLLCLQQLASSLWFVQV